jgi:hypothetical protein
MYVIEKEKKKLRKDYFGKQLIQTSFECSFYSNKTEPVTEMRKQMKRWLRGKP